MLFSSDATWPTIVAQHVTYPLVVGVVISSNLGPTEPYNIKMVSTAVLLGARHK